MSLKQEGLDLGRINGELEGRWRGKLLSVSEARETILCHFDSVDDEFLSIDKTFGWVLRYTINANLVIKIGLIL